MIDVQSVLMVIQNLEKQKAVVDEISATSPSKQAAEVFKAESCAFEYAIDLIKRLLIVDL